MNGCSSPKFTKQGRPVLLTLGFLILIGCDRTSPMKEQPNVPTRLGDACATVGDQKDGGICLNWPGGYFSRSCDTSTLQGSSRCKYREPYEGVCEGVCPADSQCVSGGGYLTFCVRACLSLRDCREGYDCISLGNEAKACLPRG
jgi:hypothetical protein